jgi:hypothetical protein
MREITDWHRQRDERNSTHSNQMQLATSDHQVSSPTATLRSITIEKPTQHNTAQRNKRTLLVDEIAPI